MKSALLVVLFLFTAQSVPGTAQMRRDPHMFLRNHIGATDDEIRRLEKGQVITRILETSADNEIAVFGVVWVNVTTDYFIEQYRDIESFEQGVGILNTKKLSAPPRLADLADLTFPEEDLDAMAECKVGDCEVEVDEPALTRLQREVDWSAEDAHDRANAIAREWMLENSQAYIEGGDKAISAYRDEKRPTFLAEELDSLLENSTYIFEYVPELHMYLDAFPKASLPGSESFLYWSKADFGLRPVIRLNHVVIYPLEAGHDASVVIASKMLYASHYFHTALDLRFLVKDPAKPGVKGFYLISLNRSRADGRTGRFGGMEKVPAERRSRRTLAKYLEKGKKQLEEAYR